MDDESYFTFDGCDQPANRGYYLGLNTKVDENIKYKRKEKFPAKLLVWCAISNKGSTGLYFLPKNGAINAETYINECISKKLIPFLREYYPNNNYLFWPDLASSHYSSKTIQMFNEKNVKFLERELNPPNVPQLRPIEHFWSQLKSKVYEKDWRAKNFQQLEKKIKNEFNKFEFSSFSHTSETLKFKVKQAIKNGPDSLL